MTLPPRAVAQGLATVNGTARQGFFIPYGYADTLPDPGALPPYPAFEALFERCRPRFAALLDGMTTLGADLRAFDGAEPPAPRWQQDWFPRLDGAAAYALVRRLAPRRIVEIGCGHSTRFLARGLRDGGGQGTLTCIDPFPRARLDGLPVHHIAATLHDAGEAPFAELDAGDVLFVDSSHILMPGTDVDVVIGRILPRLPAGVLVHIHDIFLPDPYPAAWTWRGYNEQQAVMALLLAGGFEVLWASAYAATRMGAEVAAGVTGTLPLPAGARESSLWLRKTAPALF